MNGDILWNWHGERLPASLEMKMASQGHQRLAELVSSPR